MYKIYEAKKCPCSDPACDNWYIHPAPSPQFTEQRAKAIADLLNKLEPKCLYADDCADQGCLWTPKNCPYVNPTGSFIIDIPNILKAKKG